MWQVTSLALRLEIAFCLCLEIAFCLRLEIAFCLLDSKNGHCQIEQSTLQAGYTLPLAISDSNPHSVKPNNHYFITDGYQLNELHLGHLSGCFWHAHIRDSATLILQALLANDQ